MQAYDAQTLVLCALAEGPLHGYAVNAAIERLIGQKLGPGSLYGALTRLEAKQLIEPAGTTDAQPRQRPVRLTPQGRQVLERELRSMAKVAATGLASLKVDPA
ncbi:PadR family transcriptional regulator [Kitasatospora sp. NPDC001683]